MKLFQKGFNYKQDGQGNRLVYHLSGCDLFCPWCANPEGMTAIAPIKFQASAFTATPQEIVNEAIKCKPMFFDGGGVTFTGGEPTVQFEELKRTLVLLKENGISTAIESNGTNKRLPELFPYIDILMMDVKHVDGKKLKAVTGADLQVVKANLKAAVSYYQKVFIRIPLIHGFNDDCKEAFAVFFEEVGREKVEIEILPYHEFGKQKWQDCGYEYTVQDGYVSQETIKEYKRL